MFRLKDGSTERSWNVKGPHAYIKRIGQTGRAVDGMENLTLQRARGEAAMIGVRLLDGTSAAREFPVQSKELVGAGLLWEVDVEDRLNCRSVEMDNSDVVMCHSNS